MRLNSKKTARRGPARRGISVRPSAHRLSRQLGRHSLRRRQPFAAQRSGGRVPDPWRSAARNRRAR